MDRAFRRFLTRGEADPRRYGPQIRRLARQTGLTARKSRRDGRWYFSDDTNRLRSPEQGLDDEEALEWLAADEDDRRAAEYQFVWIDWDRLKGEDQRYNLLGRAAHEYPNAEFGIFSSQDIALVVSQSRYDPARVREIPQHWYTEP